MNNTQQLAPSMLGMVPIVVEEQGNTSRSFDIFSMLMRQRIIFLNTEVNSHVAGIIMAQLLFLEAEDPKADITMYINSPGGHISAGMGIYDTMNYIKPDVSTVCTGLAASMGSFLLAAGAKGKRFALPNAEIMIHQPLGGAQGQCSDIQIQARHIQFLKDKLNGLYVGMTGQELEAIQRDTDRDNWLTAEAAKEYGLIDEVIHNR